MRGSHLKSNVESLATLEPPLGEQVRAKVADVVRQIEEAVSVAWLPLELDIRLTEAVDEVAGREGMALWARGAIVRSTEGPLFRPMLAALVRMGLTPHTAFRRVPYGWNLVYRGCGELRYESLGEHEGLIVQEGAPLLMRQSPSYVAGIAAAFDGIAQIAGGHEPRTDFEFIGDAIHYRCRWS